MSDPQDAAGGAAPPVRRPADDEISLWEVLAVLLRRRGTIVLTTVLCLGAAVALTLLRADRFTTQASFQPQGSEASTSRRSTPSSWHRERSFSGWRTAPTRSKAWASSA
jgi:uncharacterized protein involved in exopolysaccharide biosynthesis